MDKIKICKNDYKIFEDVYDEITSNIRAQYKSGDSFNSCFSIRTIDKEKEKYLKRIDKIKNEELKETMINFLDDYVNDVKRCLEGMKIFNSAHRKLKKYGYSDYYSETFTDKFNFEEHYGF